MANDKPFKVKNGLNAKRYLGKIGSGSFSSPTQTIDLSTGNYFQYSFSAATTIAFSNPPETGKALLFTLEISNSNETTTWPSSIKWEYGITPSVYSDKQIFMFLTIDGGTTYYGKKAGETFS